MSQPKLIIKERGWETFTGNLHGLNFVDGVSVDFYSQLQAERISAMIKIENELGKNPSVAQQIIDLHDTPMDKDMVRDMRTGEITTGAAMAAAMEAGDAKVWTVEELNAIADEKGIEGVREIATPMGLKGRGIAELISAILEKQGNKPKEDPNANVPAGN